MKHCPSSDCPHYGAIGAPAEYLDAIVACSDCGATLCDGAAPETAARERPIPPKLWRRLVVTLLAIPALFALPWISLPGVDAAAVRAYFARVFEGQGLSGGVRTGNLSVFALGIMPFVSAVILVVLGLLAVPRWRSLADSESGRGKLQRITIGLTAVLCVFQGYGVARLLEGLPEIYSGSALITVLTLTAGTMLLLLGAGLLSRHGLGNGFSVILAYSLIQEELPRYVGRVINVTGSPRQAGEYALIAAAPIAAVYGLLRLMRVRRPGRAPEGGGEPFIRLPASGAGPLTLAASLLTVADTMSLLGIAGVWQLSVLLQRNDTLFTVLRVALAAGLSVLMVYWFHPPARVASLWTPRSAALPDEARLVAARALVRSAAIRSALLLSGAAGISSLARRWMPYFPEAWSLFILAAVGADLVTEWKARRAAGELAQVASKHDVDAADAAARALEEAGIATHLRGIHHRSMLQLFGPYVPIEILVPSERAGEAREILRGLPGAERPEASPPKRKKRRVKAAAARE